MKNQAFRTIALLSLFTMLAAAPAYAQSADNIVLKVPFSFVVGKKTLPAGEYTVKRALSTRLTLIRNAGGRRECTTVLTMPVPPETMALAAKLIFHRYGDQYFLHQVWTPGSERGGQLFESRAELELAKSASEVQRVSIIAAR
jgi:hypothetical protein